MKRVFIIHGWSGSPEGDWIPWLARELNGAGYKVEAPAMPDPDEPVIEGWVSLLSEKAGMPDKDTYFVGHSIGCQTILRYLETVDIPVGGAVFVSGWFDLQNLEGEEEEEIAAPWIDTPIDLEKVKKVLPRSVLINSEDDPFVELEYNVHKFSELDSNVIILPNAGHITAGDGYPELPQALEAIQNLSS